jgi:hypothetical protein
MEDPFLEDKEVRWFIIKVLTRTFEIENIFIESFLDIVEVNVSRISVDLFF